jgi:pantoate--beta-alanine ligase
VTTLGALHIGHISLIARAAEENDLVIVSIFVNPTQFDDPEDYAKYPRDTAADTALAEAHGATICFVPEVDEMLGSVPRSVTVDPGPLGTILEGASRPGHFRGVATIVTKFFALVGPDAAYFGEKDFQQLVIVRSLVDELSFPIKVVACPTVREPDGLAYSSRNARLDATARAVAPTFYAALIEGRNALERGASPEEAETTMATVANDEPKITLDYAICRSARTLRPVGRDDGPRRLLIAGELGGVRLIDNLEAPPGPDSHAVE